MTIEQLQGHLARNLHSSLFARLADGFRRTQRTDEGLSLCLEGLQYFPDYATAHIIAARCLAQRGDLAGALSHFDVALRSYPDNPTLTELYNDWVNRLATSSPKLQREPKQQVPEDGYIPGKTTDTPVDSRLTSPRPRSIEDDSSGVLDDVPIVSVTLAEIYAMQGAYEAAIAMYRKLQQQKPNQAKQFETKIQELKGKISQGE